MAIADTWDDATLTKHPLVEQEGIRSYCGAPLRTTDGFGIGTLAVLDRLPRTPTDNDCRQLAALARILMDEFYLQHVARMAQSTQAAELARRELREDHIKGLLRELAHRGKNLLAVVQALAWQTTFTSGSVPDYARNLTSRIQGLAETHDVIAEQEWRGIAMEDLVSRQVLPVGTTPVSIEGPRVMLSSPAAQNIGLALNELTTNCLKSVPAGVRRAV